MVGSQRDSSINAVSRYGVSEFYERRRMTQLDCPVRINTLGRFSVSFDEQVLNSHAKARHQRPLELLQALIALGGRDVHAELLSEALWPDSDGDKSQSAFDVTLHRLRQLIDLENVVIVRNRHVTLNDELVWVDVWEFERNIDQAERLLGRIGEPDVANELVHIGDLIFFLYQGTFLQREAARPWSLSLRERLSSKLLRHVVESGHAWESTGQWDRAIRCYRKALEIDPLYETLYACLMRALYGAGHLSEALATYQHCRAVLAEQFRVEPSPSTIKLYRSLTT